MARVGSALIPTFALLLALASLARPQQQGTLLQQRAIQRIDRYVDHFRRTGDRMSLVPELLMAERELFASYQMLTSSDAAAASLSLVHLAGSLRMREQYQDAIKVHQMAAQLASQAAHPGYASKALVGLARTEALGLRNYGSAGARVEQALQLSAPLADRSFYLDALAYKATFQAERGELIAAIGTVNRVIGLAAEINDSVKLFYAYYDRADMYRKLADGCDAQYRKAVQACHEAWDLATADYRKAQALATRLEFHALAAQMSQHIRMLDTSRQMGGQVQSLAKKLAGLRIWEPVKPSEVLVTTQFIAGGQTGGLELSLLIAGAGLPDTDPRGMFVKASMAETQGKSDEALQLYLRALEMLERDRRDLRDESGRGTFLEDKIVFYDPPILHLLHRGRYAEAFDLLERARGRAMADLLASRSPSFANHAERETYAALTAVRAEISALQKELFDRGSGPAPERYTAEMKALEAKIAAAESRHQRLLERVSAGGGRLQQLVFSTPVALADLQRMMRQDGFELLHYMVREEGVILWHIGGDAVNARSVFLPRAELVKKVAELRQSLEDANQPFNEKRSRELFLFLLQPALGWLKTNRLVIVPHEDLTLLPFQALQDPADGRFAGERFRISYAPSATVLAGLRPVRNLSGARVFAAADPDLADAQQEVKTIEKLFAGSSTVSANALPRESDVKGASGYGIVHLAVHGRFDAREPMLSHLKLAKGPGEDGQLTAAEMFGLPLEKTALVTLSACETGRAVATRSNETMGMIRALLYAGAQSLVLSAWEVNSESTSLWMQHFYREALAKPPAEAARLATVALRSDPRYRHPFHWAPFLVIGR